MTPELTTFLIAMSPIVELRGAIPWAILQFGLPPWSAYLWAVLGNLVALCLIVGTGDAVLKFLSRYAPLLGRIVAYVFEHTRKTHESKMTRWGKGVAVAILVATPIPFVGGWTGAIAALVLGMKLKQALPFLLAGSLGAGIIVIITTLGVSAFL